MSIRRSGIVEPDKSERSLQNACQFRQRVVDHESSKRVVDRNVLRGVGISDVRTFPGPPGATSSRATTRLPDRTDLNAPPQIRQVPPRPGQQSPPDQSDPNAPPQVREVAPRGSAPQAMMSRAAPTRQAPRYQLRQPDSPTVEAGDP